MDDATPLHDPRKEPAALRSLLGRTNRDWWPNQLSLDILHQHGRHGDPMGDDFDYAEAFKSLDYAAVKRDLTALMTDSQPWWPADYGHYGPFFIRMAWHSAGTYRTGDGRGGASSGTQRFAPLNSLAGQRQSRQGAPPALADQAEIRRASCQLGRPDDPGRQRRHRIDGRAGVRLRRRPRRRLGAREGHLLGHRGVVGRPRAEPDPDQPEGRGAREPARRDPDGPDLRQSRRARAAMPDPLQSARDIRETFARMAMNDEETVALTAGGHTFGKCHGAGDASKVGAEPEGADIAQQGLGWQSGHESGMGDHTITSGLEGAWTPTPITLVDTTISTCCSTMNTSW